MTCASIPKSAPEPFLWDEACDQAFLAFKKTIATPLVLSRLKPGAPLLPYLSVAEEAMSSALIQEDGKHQIPIYFVSRVLHDVEKRYQMIEMVTLALITFAMPQAILLESLDHCQDGPPHQASVEKA